MIFNLFNTKKNKHCFAFYNIENLFDIYNEEHRHDGDFTETSEKRWTLKRYKNKINKISFAISKIGLKETKMYPALIGLAEVENEAVLKDLIKHENLKDCNYSFVHYNSKDERGIDVAFIYDTKRFSVLNSKVHSILLHDEDGDVDYTRDVLHIYGTFLGEKIDVIVNHWPSRRDGNNETSKKRMIASNKVAEVITGIRLKNNDAKIVVMGDFNDDPSSESIKSLVDNNQLFNPMDTLLSIDRGT
ncbi:endonuclease, partial [Aurantibacter sp.]|uniref:endonuclease/exonuclease/phosphatase family protein n=1 Tax=Aurantibacter sp. TaxID=2807103 RepID=UPI0035C78FDC